MHQSHRNSNYKAASVEGIEKIQMMSGKPGTNRLSISCLLTSLGATPTARTSWSGRVSAGFIEKRDIARRIRVTDYVPAGLSTPCFHWMGAHDSRGYARLRLGRRVGYVRRLLFREANGCVVSLCRNPGCVNRHHHLVVTPAEAPAFSRRGRIGIGELFVVARMVEEGQDIAQVAVVLGVSPKALLAAISLLDKARCRGTAWAKKQGEEQDRPRWGSLKCI